MQHYEAVLCLVLALVVSTMYFVERIRHWDNNPEQRRYRKAAILLWSFGFLLGVQQNWWRFEDGLVIVMVVLVVCALHTEHHDLTVLGLVFSIASMELWQMIRWYYGSWQLAAMCVACAVIPSLLYCDLKMLSQELAERAARRLDTASIPAF